MDTKGVSSFKIAGAFIGTIIGAGFATGQEILQFFVAFGNEGLIGLVLVTVLFILFGYKIMIFGQKLKSKSHNEVIKYTCGAYVGYIIDKLTTFFLLGGLTVMFAGTGALLTQQFGMSKFLGSVFMAFATSLTVIFGLSGVISSISVMVPFLIISAVGVSAASMMSINSNDNITLTSFSSNILTQNWLLSSILYVSYNILLSVAVLAPLGKSVLGTKAIRNGAILGGIGLGFTSVFIYAALLIRVNSVNNIEVPMVYIAGQISPVIQTIYILALLIAIYTTAVGCLYGFTSRIIEIKKADVRIIIILTSVFGLIGSQLGFSVLVKYLYPLVGYGGLFLLGGIIYKEVISQKNKLSNNEG